MPGAGFPSRGLALSYLMRGGRGINNWRIWRGFVVAAGALSRDHGGLDGQAPQDERQARANRPLRPGLRHAGRVWPRLSCTPLAALDFAITGGRARHVLIEKVEQLFWDMLSGITWPRDRRKYDREPEHGAKQEQHRRDLGETNRIRVKRRLMELRTWTGCINPKWIFSLFAHYSSCFGNGFYTIGQFSGR